MQTLECDTFICVISSWLLHSVCTADLGLSAVGSSELPVAATIVGLHTNGIAALQHTACAAEIMHYDALSQLCNVQKLAMAHV